MNAWGSAFAAAWGNSFGDTDSQPVVTVTQTKGYSAGSPAHRSRKHRKYVEDLRGDLVTAFAFLEGAPEKVRAEASEIVRPVALCVAPRIEVDYTALLNDAERVRALLALYEREVAERDRVASEDEMDVELLLMHA